MTRQGARQQAAPQRRSHPGLVLVTTIAVTLLGISLLLATTVLNAGFTSRVLTTGPAPEILQGAINQAAKDSGVPADLVTKPEAQQLLKTAVRQVYSGQPVNLDLTPIESRLANQVGAATGLPTELIGGAAAAMVGNQLTTTVNSRVNTPEVQELTNWLTTGRRVNQVALVVLGGLVMGCVLVALNRPDVQTPVVLFWAFLWALLLTAGLVAALAANAASFVSDPQVGPAVADLVLAVCRRGWQLVIGLAGLDLVALVSRLITVGMLEKRPPV